MPPKLPKLVNLGTLGIYSTGYGTSLIAYNDNRCNAKEAKNPKVAAQGHEPSAVTSYNSTTYANTTTPAGAETVHQSDFPPDLRKIIDHWDNLPPEVKQTILTLVKHSRPRKTAKVH